MRRLDRVLGAVAVDDTAALRLCRDVDLGLDLELYGCTLIQSVWDFLGAEEATLLFGRTT